MKFKLSPTREAAITASQRAESDLVAAQKDVSSARSLPEKAAAATRVAEARETARDAQAKVTAEHAKAKAAGR
ncbi:hypothetical protein [Streptomyces sp. NPDC002403]